MLWVALKALQADEPEAVAVVYTGDVGQGEGKVTKDEVIAKVKVNHFRSVRHTTQPTRFVLTSDLVHRPGSTSPSTQPGWCSSL